MIVKKISKKSILEKKKKLEITERRILENEEKLLLIKSIIHTDKTLVKRLKEYLSKHNE